MRSSYRGEDWYSAQFVHNDQATCMECDQPIYFCQSLNVDRHRKASTVRGFWALTKLPTFDTFWFDGVPDADHDHQPKQFCRTVPSREGTGHCGRHVKYEDQVSEIYACGHHRAAESAAMVQREREEKRRKEEARRDEINRYEISQYELMAQWLRDNGHEALVESYRASDGYSRSPRINRIVKVDLHLLYNLLRGGEEDEGTDVHSEQALSGSVDDREVPVHAGQPLDPFDD